MGLELTLSMRRSTPSAHPEDAAFLLDPQLRPATSPTVEISGQVAAVCEGSLSSGGRPQRRGSPEQG